MPTIGFCLLLSLFWTSFKPADLHSYVNKACSYSWPFKHEWTGSKSTEPTEIYKWSSIIPGAVRMRRWCFSRWVVGHLYMLVWQISAASSAKKENPLDSSWLICLMVLLLTAVRTASSHAKSGSKLLTFGFLYGTAEEIPVNVFFRWISAFGLVCSAVSALLKQARPILFIFLKQNLS